MAVTAGALDPAMPPREEPFALVVEDNEDARRILEELLRADGYRVETASNGAVALELLAGARGHPFIAVVDVAMPVMDGLEFCRRAAKRPEFRGVPVWMMSASQMEAGGIPAIRGLFRKPFDWDDLRKIAAQAYLDHRDSAR